MYGVYFQWSTKVEKGDYKLKVEMCDRDEALLDRFRDHCVVLQFKLPSPLNLDVYDSYKLLMTPNGRKFSSLGVTASPGSIVAAYVAPLADDKYLSFNCTFVRQQRRISHIGETNAQVAEAGDRWLLAEWCDDFGQG